MAEIKDGTKKEFAYGNIVLATYGTGRKNNRGQLHITVGVCDENQGADFLSPDEARKLAAALIDMADAAEKFTTRGFQGSDE